MNVQFGSDKVKAIEFNIKGIKCDNPEYVFFAIDINIILG